MESFLDFISSFVFPTNGSSLALRRDIRKLYLHVLLKIEVTQRNIEFRPASCAPRAREPFCNMCYINLR